MYFLILFNNEVAITFEDDCWRVSLILQNEEYFLLGCSWKICCSFSTCSIWWTSLEVDGLLWQSDSWTKSLCSSNCLQRSYTMPIDLAARSMAESCMLECRCQIIPFNLWLRCSKCKSHEILHPLLPFVFICSKLTDQLGSQTIKIEFNFVKSLLP